MTEPPSGRADTPAGRLARLGVPDAQRTGAALMEVGWWSEDLLEDVGAAADPGQVVRTALDLQAADPQRIAAVARDSRAWRRFALTTGVSVALAEHLVRHPEHLEILFEDSPPPGPQALRDQIVDAVTGVGSGAADALRVAHRAALLRIAIADVAHAAHFELTALRLSELADAVLSGALAAAREQLPADAPQARLAIIGMGKCGGRELNYISDVDVIFVAEPAEGVEESAALRTATTLASSVMRLCSQPTAEGAIWEVDANLRPEGRAGALVRTLRSHVGYYERWAKTWEFQALLKARAVAGDEELGAAYIDAVLPFVWSAADRDGFVTEVQRMRQRVERNVPAKDADRQLKLGRGGLRDVEFSVQLLQLVHGRSDVMLRSPTTLTALESLATWGYVGREDASGLAGAYRFLRTLEHRIQMHRMVRSHVVPREDEDLRRLGRSMGFMADPGKELVEAWQRRAHEVRRIHEKLFYRPLLDAVARLDSGQARLTPQAARERLDALGFRDPAGALNHIEALTSGVSRRAAIQRTLLPVMLGWFADAPDPDAGLLGFRRVSEDLGGTPWYLRLLRDESACAERMARVLASSRYASELLQRAPDGVALLADAAELRPRQSGPLTAEFLATAARYDEAAEAVAAVRALRRRELFRISATDILQPLTVDDVGNALTDVADATISGALQAATAELERARGSALPTRMLVIGMGRYGGERSATAATPTSCSSTTRCPVSTSARRPRRRPWSPTRSAPCSTPRRRIRRCSWTPTCGPRASRARRCARSPRTWPTTTAGAPSGRPRRCCVPTSSRGTRRYGRGCAPGSTRSAGPPTGSAPTSCARSVGSRPGWRTSGCRGVRTRPCTPSSDRGGLSDVEWVIQLLQLQHAHRIPELRTTRTMAALEAARRTGLLDPADADVLSDAWRMATRIRNVVMLVRGRATDMVPTEVHELGAVSRILGYAPGESGALLEDYRRTTRRARAAAERLFYGQ